MAETIITLPSNNIAINDFGNLNGKVILINHGMIASIKDEKLFKKLIDNEFRIITIARPGYGRSSIYELSNISEWGILVRKIMNQLNIENYSVFGISSGAPYSYGIAFNDKNVKNLYILSGTPALYDDEVQKNWPYPIDKNLEITDLQKIAKEFFFENDYKQNGINIDKDDSYNNDCYGIALDLYIRIRDWGFTLENIENPCFMESMKNDTEIPFKCLEITKEKIKNVKFFVKEEGNHFSQEILDNFIEEIIVKEEIKEDA